MLNFRKNISVKVLRTLIIDDEQPVRETLRNLLLRTCPQVNVVGEADSVASGIKAIREKAPELLLLGIRMADGTGFDLLEHYDNIPFRVIFVTAYEEYAIRAFSFSAIDYLLKPVNPEKLVNAVKRAEVISRQAFNMQLEALRDNLENIGNQNKKIILKNQESIFLLNTSDIVHCMSEGSYTAFETSDNQNILVSKNLKEYDTLLSGSGFLRVHRSHLINLKHIKRFDKHDGGNVVMSNGAQIPVSASGRERLLDLFEEISG
ncbi:two component transcriptional regulator, LytTR family [Lentimicrobium saccharophilum]|uniref:Two component transcriptional regulator, LytTR family n=1 Tax=Lentimicrobium saccharophilum TaxID=1678841 RepID=A0A0S7BUT0_9BACT|nr:LytTR family transcriptional regulator DNA-binding domain-containing protein [Lentimicrobium saccharophilum]GAP44269.1 two component transcriptional regulator, LytTR family [Lentimicrobium saccharophilum]